MTAHDDRARDEQPAPTAGEIPADELAAAERFLRSRAKFALYDYERDQFATLMAEFDRRGAIERRARGVCDGTVTNGAPWQQNAAIALYILGEA